MQTRTINKKRILKTGFRFMLAGIVFFFCLSIPVPESKADMVTDYIGVRVGYIGMDFEDYVLAGDYHISEIEASLPIYEEAYSFFSWKADPSQYTYVVDSARGLYVSDLLNLAHVYYGDVYNLSFYVLDHNSIWASFDRDDLFSYNRYYFNDLPSHRRIIYGTYTDGEGKEQTDYGRILGYDFEEAWSDCQTVQPMMAIEDNWATFTEEFESAGPDFSWLNTSTRFRLLYGQYSPTSEDMQRSAKYTRWVYVTLYGKPQIGEIPELDGSLGSHTVETTISVDNADLAASTEDLLHFFSTDESVLRINSISISPDPNYSDLMKVIIDYEIVGEGMASIGASFAGIEDIIPEETQQKMTVNTEDYNAPKNESTPSGMKDDTKKDNGLELSTDAQIELLQGIDGATYIFELSGDLQDEMNELMHQNLEDLLPGENVKEVMIEDKTAEQKDRSRKIVLFTGLGCILMGGAGALSEYIGFKIRLKKSLRKNNI